MSKMKAVMMKGMNAVMLYCDRATFLATKNEVEPLGCIQQMQVKLHLMGCKFCRAFSEQSKIISKELETIKKADPNNLRIHLTEDQKERLQHTVDENRN